MPSVYSSDKSVAQTYFELASQKYPGVYLTWDPLTPDDFGLNVTATAGEQVIQRIYSVSKCPQINGNYTEVGRLTVPDNEFLDEFGKPGYYYIVQLLEVNLATASETIIATSSPFNGEEQLIKTSLAYEVKQFLDIPVYDDELIFNSDRTSAKLGYNSIIYSPRPQIRISANSKEGYEESFKIIDFVSGLPYSSLTIANASTDYTINTQSGNQVTTGLYYNLKENGQIYFRGAYNGITYPIAIPYYDTVLASYHV